MSHPIIKPFVTSTHDDGKVEEKHRDEKDAISIITVS